MENTSWIYLLTNYKFLYFINDLKKIFLDNPSSFRFPYKYVTIPPIVFFKKKYYLTKPSIDYLINKHGMSGMTNRDEIVKFLFLFTLSSTENTFIPQKDDHFFNIAIKWYRFFTQHFYFKNKKYDCFDLFVFLLIFLQDLYTKDNKLPENLINEFDSFFPNKNDIFYFVLTLISKILSIHYKNFDALIDKSVFALLFSCIEKSAFVKAFNSDSSKTVVSKYNSNFDFDKVLNHSLFSSYIEPEIFEKFGNLFQKLDTSIIMKFHDFILSKKNIDSYNNDNFPYRTKILFDILLCVMILMVLSHKYSVNNTYNSHNIHSSNTNHEYSVSNSISDSYNIDKTIKFTIKDIYVWLIGYIEGKNTIKRYQKEILTYIFHLISNTYNAITQNCAYHFITNNRSNILFFEPLDKRIYFMIPSYELRDIRLNLNSIKKYSKDFIEFIDKFVGKIGKK